MRFKESLFYGESQFSAIMNVKICKFFGNPSISLQLYKSANIFEMQQIWYYIKSPTMLERFMLVP